MKFNTNKNSVALRIKQIRLNKGYTLEAFGKLFDVSKSNVLKWEQGQMLPNKERLASISKIADITVNELLYGSIDEFISNNTEILLKHVGFPFPKTFEMFDIKNGINDYIDFEREHNNKEVTINDIDYLMKLFSALISDIVEEDIIKYIDYNIELLENNQNETISALVTAKEVLNSLNNKLCPIDISLLENDSITFYSSFIKLIKDNLLAKVNYYPVFHYLVEQLKTEDNKPLHQRLYEIVDRYFSEFGKQPNENQKQIKKKLVDEIIGNINK